MAWWSDILQLIKREFDEDASAKAAPEAMHSAKTAQQLLQRSAKELADARARAEAARRRLQRAQEELDTLVQNETHSVAMRDRLADLAQAIAHESEMVKTFDTHIENLARVQAKVAHQYAHLQRDLDMARSAKIAAATTQVVAPQQSPKRSAETTTQSDLLDAEVLASLKTLPKRAKAARSKPAKGKG